MNRSLGLVGALALATLASACATPAPLTAEQRLACEKMLGRMSDGAAAAGGNKSPGPTPMTMTHRQCRRGLAS